MHAHIHTRIHIHTYTHTHECTHIHKCTYTFAHTSITYTHTNTSVHSHTYTHMCVHMHIHTHKGAHIHIHEYTHIHTSIQAYAYTHKCTCTHIQTWGYTYTHMGVHTHLKSSLLSVLSDEKKQQEELRDHESVPQAWRVTLLHDIFVCFIFISLLLSFLLMCMCACMHAMPMKFRRGHQIPWVWSFPRLWTASFVFWKLNWDPLGTEPRATAIFNILRGPPLEPSTRSLSEATLLCWTVNKQRLLSENKIVIQAYHSSPLLALSCIFPSGLEAPSSVTLTMLSSLSCDHLDLESCQLVHHQSKDEQTQSHQHGLAASLVFTSSSGDYFVCGCNALARGRRPDVLPPSVEWILQTHRLVHHHWTQL